MVFTILQGVVHTRMIRMLANANANARMICMLHTMIKTQSFNSFSLETCHQEETYHQ